MYICKVPGYVSYSDHPEGSNLVGVRSWLVGLNKAEVSPIGLK